MEKAKRLFALLLTLAMMLSIAACGGQSNTTKPEDTTKPGSTNNTAATSQAPTQKDAGDNIVKIGVLMPFSGTSARQGEVGRMGIDMAVEEINADGGIKSMNGAKIQVIYADSQSDATVGVTETEKLINVEKVDMMLGSFNSAVTLPCTAIAEKYKIPWVVNSATSDAITEQGNKYTFRAYYVNSTGTDQEIQMISDLGVAQGDPIKTVAILYEDSEGGQTWAAGIRTACEKYGITIVFDEGYPPGSTDFTTPIVKMKSANADAILDFSYTSEAILVAQAIADMELKPKLLVGWGGHVSPEFASNDFAEGWISMLSWCDDLNDPDSLAFVKSHKAKYGEDPEPVAANGYNDMWMIKEVLELAGSVEADAVREAFLNIKIDGGKANIVKGTGPVVFDANGQNPNASQMGAQYINGKIRSIWPIEYANPDYKLIWPYGSNR